MSSKHPSKDPYFLADTITYKVQARGYRHFFVEAPCIEHAIDEYFYQMRYKLKPKSYHVIVKIGEAEELRHATVWYRGNNDLSIRKITNPNIVQRFVLKANGEAIRTFTSIHTAYRVLRSKMGLTCSVDSDVFPQFCGTIKNTEFYIERHATKK